MPLMLTRSDGAASYGPLRAVQGFGALALVLFAMVGLHPERLASVPQLSQHTPLVFSFLAQAHLYISFLALVLFLRASGYRRWMAGLLAVFGLGFLVEYCGLKFGIPFGYYAYSDLLGPRIAGCVPLVVPISWFTMGLASYVFVSNLLPRQMVWPRHLLTACFLTCWDLVLDPAMSHVNKFWWWQDPGVYYGVPWSNFVGWLLTGLAMSLLFEIMLRQPVTSLDRRWFAEYYLTNFLLSWGIMASAGLELGCAVAAVVLVALSFVTRVIGGQTVAAPCPSGN